MLLPALLLGLAACGGPAADAGRSDGAAPPPRPAGRTSVPPAAEDGTRTDACFDGRCEVALSAPTNIGLDGKHGVDHVSVDEIAEDGVAVSCAWGSQWRDGDGSGGSSGARAAVMAEGNVLPCHNLDLRLVSLAHGTVVLAIAPG